MRLRCWTFWFGDVVRCRCYGVTLHVWFVCCCYVATPLRLIVYVTLLDRARTRSVDCRLHALPFLFLVVLHWWFIYRLFHPVVIHCYIVVSAICCCLLFIVVVLVPSVQHIDSCIHTLFDLVVVVVVDWHLLHCCSLLLLRYTFTLLPLYTLICCLYVVTPLRCSLPDLPFVMRLRVLAIPTYYDLHTLICSLNYAALFARALDIWLLLLFTLPPLRSTVTGEFAVGVTLLHMTFPVCCLLRLRYIVPLHFVALRSRSLPILFVYRCCFVDVEPALLRWWTFTRLRCSIVPDWRAIYVITFVYIVVVCSRRYSVVRLPLLLLRCCVVCSCLRCCYAHCSRCSCWLFMLLFVRCPTTLNVLAATPLPGTHTRCCLLRLIRTRCCLGALFVGAALRWTCVTWPRSFTRCVCFTLLFAAFDCYVCDFTNFVICSTLLFHPHVVTGDYVAWFCLFVVVVRYDCDCALYITFVVGYVVPVAFTLFGDYVPEHVVVRLRCYVDCDLLRLFEHCVELRCSYYDCCWCSLLLHIVLPTRFHLFPFLHLVRFVKHTPVYIWTTLIFVCTADLIPQLRLHILHAFRYLIVEHYVGWIADATRCWTRWIRCVCRWCVATRCLRLFVYAFALLPLRWFCVVTFPLCVTFPTLTLCRCYVVLWCLLLVTFEFIVDFGAVDFVCLLLNACCSVVITGDI